MGTISTAIIIGAGPTGLSTALQLTRRGWKVIVIEKEKKLGGVASTKNLHGYFVDNGPHKLYPQVPCAMPLIQHFVGDRLETIPKKSSIYLNNKYIPYPFSFIDLVKSLGLTTGMRTGISFAANKCKNLFKRSQKTYTDFVIAHFGKFSQQLVFRPMCLKLWGDPDALHIQLAKIRIITPRILDLLKSLLSPFHNKSQLSADVFYYPKDGIQILWEAMAKEIQEKQGIIIRGAKITKILRPPGHLAKSGKFQVHFLVNGHHKNISAPVLISTAPIKKTYELLDPPILPEVMAAVRALKLASLLILYLVIDTPRILNLNWIFFPEGRYHFSRISEQKSFSKKMIPEDRTVLMVEIPLAREFIRRKDRNQLVGEAIKQLGEVGILEDKHKVLEYFFRYNESIYPIYDLDYQRNLKTVLVYSDAIPNFYLNGRLGLFCYNNMDHSMEMGVELADHIADRRPLEDWKKRRETFYKYKIID